MLSSSVRARRVQAALAVSLPNGDASTVGYVGRAADVHIQVQRPSLGFHPCENQQSFVELQIVTLSGPCYCPLEPCVLRPSC